MQPIKLEIFLDDKTLAGMKSAEGNIAALESFNRQMVERLQGELKQLERQYKHCRSRALPVTGNSPTYRRSKVSSAV